MDGLRIGPSVQHAARPVEAVQLPPEAPPARVKLVEVVAGAVELLRARRVEAVVSWG